MFDFSDQLDRALTYRLGVAYDCWGSRRAVRRASHNGLWLVDTGNLDEPAADDHTPDTNSARERLLQVFVASGRFTQKELATLRALVLERSTLDEIAERDGCSRQAVMARLAGNSRGQGGILKKARALLGATACGGQQPQKITA